MTDEELVKLAREWSENDLPKPPFYSTGLLILAMADRIEELEDKLVKTVRGLNAISVWGEDTYARDIARTTLVEIEEESK
jgi:hypothetical protein